MDFNKLKAPFPHEKISWRVGATNKEKTSAIALAYIDARDVADRLDEVCGPQGWQDLYPHAGEKTSCKIGIFCPPDPTLGGSYEWIWKENGCGDSDIEAAKGAFSDALKRAAVMWGIGRYLYDVPNIWVDIVPYGKSYKIKNPQDAKLKAALISAEKGIRLPDEPEEIIKPVDGAEFLLMQNEIKSSKSIEELKAAWDKINLAASRLNPDQLKTLGVIKDGKKLALTQTPIG